MAETTSSFASRTMSPARLGPWVVGLLALGATWYGWSQSEELEIIPKTGIGYLLGIFGSVLMLLLAIYPIRKRHPSWRVIGSIPLWFNLHKILGIAGPVIILFHSNFGLGARNSNVALFATLIVMTSGIIGRYIYSRINSSIYDGKSALRGLLTDVDAFRDHLGDGVGASDLLAEIRAFGQMAVDRPPQTMIGSLVFGGLLDARSRVLRRRIVAAAQSELAARATEAGWSWFEQMRRSARVDAVVSSYFRRLRNVARHHFFERLFSLWHVMHLPLYFLMIVTALVHVWAVHRY